MRVVLAVVFLVGALTRFPSPTHYPGLRRAHAVDAETRQLLSSLPMRAALFTHHFETGFLVGYQRFVEGARPDVSWAHLPFTPNPSYAERVRAARPELSPVIDARRAPNDMAMAWSTLDTSHGVRIEPDVLNMMKLQSSLKPAGQLWAPQGSPVTTEVWPPLDAGALAEATQDRQVRAYLAWRRYIDAAYACTHGFRDRAHERLAELEKLVPDDERFKELRKACE
jgi:hypothetical protein